MTDDKCDCTDEYGPCELHGEVLASGAGAAFNTADEQCVYFLEDALAIDPECLSPYGRDVLERAKQGLEQDRNAHSGVAWLNDHDLADELRDVVHQVESHLDAWVYWDDGYQIIRPSDDCPLVD